MAERPATRRGSMLRWSNWNLLLLVPLFILITPLYNRDEPRLLGMPMFYWFQFLVIPLGVAATLTVYFKTRTRRADEEADTPADPGDEGQERP